MTASATDTHHSQQTSQHSSSSQATGDCPDQLTTSAGSFENNDGPFENLSVAAFTWLHDISNSSASQFFGNHTTPQSSTQGEFWLANNPNPFKEMRAYLNFWGPLSYTSSCCINPRPSAVILHALRVRPIQPAEASRFQQLMQAHHYLGALPKSGETLWYVALWQPDWVARRRFSAAAWKWAARDRWIGWPYHHQYARWHLLATNRRVLILPTWHRPNLASRTLALCQRRLSTNWQERFGLLLETFVDPTRFQGTLSKASNCSGLVEWDT